MFIAFPDLLIRPMSRYRVLGIAALLPLLACDGLKEALSAHVDVVAEAGGQELSVQHLADLMGGSQVPVRREVARSIADAWVNYHLIGKAVAEGDSLNAPKLIDDVMWPVFTAAKTQKYYQQVSETWVADTSNMQAAFDRGELLAARHILFPVQAGQDDDRAAVQQRAEAVRARATTANFAALAKQYGSDGTKDQGGDLGVFGPGAMVPAFEAGIRAIKPGEIGPLVQTDFGFHVVRRSTFDEVREQFAQQYLQVSRAAAESTFIARLEEGANIEMKPTLAKTVKAIAEDPDAYLKDRTAVATSRLGNFTAAKVSKWLMGFPNPDQIRGQIAQAPDSVLGLFVQSLLRNELILAAADSAGVAVDSTEKADIYRTFGMLYNNASAGLRIAPAALGDSAKTPEEKKRVIPARIDAYLNALVQGQEQFVEVPPPLASAVRQKYSWKINPAGLDRAVEQATAIRAKADSAASAAAPTSAVPMPGAPKDTTR